MTIDEKINEQIKNCVDKFMTKLDYYKLMFRFFLFSLGTISIILLTVIGWSYNPIRDIAVLKREVMIMNEKIDKLLKNKSVKINKEILDPVDYDKIINIKTPALSAVCDDKYRNKQQ